MEVTVRFTGMLRGLAGSSSLELTLDEGATLRSALQAVGEQVTGTFEEQVIRPLLQGGLPVAVLLLNRAILPASTELERPLRSGDILAFVMPMEGG
jgi:molybdopterin converting factor small subunit